jgi:hypothetical protein
MILLVVVENQVASGQPECHSALHRRWQLIEIWYFGVFSLNRDVALVRPLRRVILVFVSILL